MFWFYVLPLGFLLTMYTQTGYDASAHISEETHGAAKAAAQGVWRSVFWSGVGGWFVLLAITFAATDVDGINEGFGSSLAVFATAIPGGWEKFVVVIATIGQLFCGMACVTSCSRMMYAFSRDRAVPGWRIWTRLNHHRVPGLRRHRLLRRRRADDRAGARSATRRARRTRSSPSSRSA